MRITSKSLILSAYDIRSFFIKLHKNSNREVIFISFHFLLLRRYQGIRMKSAKWQHQFRAKRGKKFYTDLRKREK